MKNYSDEILDKILEKLMLGETLTQICKNKDYPSLSGVYKWMRKDEKINDQILQARKTGAATRLDQAFDLLDKDVKPQDVQWNRERLHHYRWVASKMIGIYGDKSKIEQDSNVTYKFVWDDGKVKPKAVEAANKDGEKGFLSDKVEGLARTI